MSQYKGVVVWESGEKYRTSLCDTPEDALETAQEDAGSGPVAQIYVERWDAGRMDHIMQLAKSVWERQFPELLIVGGAA